MVIWCLLSIFFTDHVHEGPCSLCLRMRDPFTGIPFDLSENLSTNVSAAPPKGIIPQTACQISQPYDKPFWEKIKDHN